MRVQERIKQVEHARDKGMSFILLCNIHPYFKRFNVSSEHYYGQLLHSLRCDLMKEQSEVLNIAPQFYSATGDIKECVELAYMLIDEVYNAEGED